MITGTSACGTPGAVKRHWKEGTEPCEEDRIALRAYQRQWRLRRKRRFMREAATATSERLTVAAAPPQSKQALAAAAAKERAVLQAHLAGELVLG